MAFLIVTVWLYVFREPARGDHDLLGSGSRSRVSDENDASTNILAKLHKVLLIRLLK